MQVPRGGQRLGARVRSNMPVPIPPLLPPPLALHALAFTQSPEKGAIRRPMHAARTRTSSQLHGMTHDRKPYCPYSHIVLTNLRKDPCCRKLNRQGLGPTNRHHVCAKLAGGSQYIYEHIYMIIIVTDRQDRQIHKCPLCFFISLIFCNKLIPPCVSLSPL